MLFVVFVLSRFGSEPRFGNIMLESPAPKTIREVRLLEQEIADSIEDASSILISSITITDWKVLEG